LKSKSVLTVGDAADFLQADGEIQFKVADSVQISFNLDQARTCSLNIQTKMLEVASDILENGMICPKR
jgi:hypothetical protein